MASIKEVSTNVAPGWEQFSIRLPHPYLTRYNAQSTDVGKIQSAYNTPDGLIKQAYSITCADSSAPAPKTQPPFPLHNSALWFSPLSDGNNIPNADNTSWARARRYPSTTIGWTSVEPPTIAQVWLLIYSIFTVHHSEEAIRLAFVGTESALLRTELLAVGLATTHPVPFNADPASETWVDLADREVLLLRSSFWQGAGSPFGSKAAWIPSSISSSRQPVHTFPIFPATQTITTKFPTARIHTLHPIRPSKPLPGSIIYSRYIPHLDEIFSMIALDYTDADHVKLFNAWQNDPRVAAGWNETGTQEQHRKYLKDLHDDTHTLTMFACFNDKPFAYFEVYWAKEDHLGAHYVAGDWDRGRHSLVGDATFRGPHRAHAWWSSLMHYMFLDEPRTEYVVGEPKLTNTRVLELDALHGFHVEKFVDLPHKRSAFVRCSRERYFGLCTVGMPFEGRVKQVLGKL